MKTKNQITKFGIILLCTLLIFGCTSEESNPAGNGEPAENLKAIVEITVAGKIQTDDPWTSGAKPINEWAKPIYRIWFDGNGNAADGSYGNGAGPRQAEIWMDTGVLGFLWYGNDKKLGTDDDVKLYPLFTISETLQTQSNISAMIKNNGKTLMVSIPLAKIGAPSSLEISTMTSPWTTSAGDNLGLGAYSTPCWVCLNCGSCGTNYMEDLLGDVSWPELIPNKADNFDISIVNVAIEKY